MTPQMLLQWQFEPVVMAGVLIAALLYWRGAAYARSAGLLRDLPAWRVLCFGGGLFAVVLALESPIDSLSDTYLTMHMVQHLVLIFIAAPLLLWGAPLSLWWRAVPLNTRRQVLRGMLVHNRVRQTGHALGRVFGTPRGAWLIFVIDFIGWHFPFMYNLALNYQFVHDFEHMCFLSTGLLFWAQVIPSAPIRPSLGYMARALFIFSAGIAMNFVSLALVYSNQPIYSYYTHLPRTAGMPTALVDQSGAGGVMNIFSVVALGFSFCILMFLWLEADEGTALPGESPVWDGRWRRNRARQLSTAMPDSVVVNGVRHRVRPLYVPTPAPGSSARSTDAAEQSSATAVVTSAPVIPLPLARDGG